MSPIHAGRLADRHHAHRRQLVAYAGVIKHMVENRVDAEAASPASNPHEQPVELQRPKSRSIVSVPMAILLTMWCWMATTSASWASCNCADASDATGRTMSSIGPSGDANETWLQRGRVAGGIPQAMAWC